VNIMKNLTYISLLIITLALLLITACDYDTNPALPNQPPETTIANIPVVGDTLFSLVNLQWDGGDSDGYIVGYEYRYHTKYVTSGDSIHRSTWNRTEDQSLTLAFDSKDLINLQHFEVRSVDNSGAVDPSPASKHFYTEQAVAPVANIILPGVDSEWFALPYVTDWWQGIKIAYTASDLDGEVVEYAWAVDDGDWNWTTDTTVYVSPDYFSSLEGEHKIKVIARDNTNIESINPTEISIKLFTPSFDKRILILDDTFEDEFPAGNNDTDEKVDKLYADIFDVQNEDDWWDYSDKIYLKSPLPPKELLGQYKLIVWHADHRAGGSGTWHHIAENEDYIKDYLDVGGNLILGGWRVLRSFVQSGAIPYDFPDTTFANQYLHIKRMTEPSLQLGNFIGAITTGDPRTRDTLKVDQSKLLGDFRLGGKLSDVNIISRVGAFTENLLTYDGVPGNETFLQYYGLPVASLYRGTSFKVVVLGFPLYFLEEESAHLAANYILNKLDFQ